LINSKIFAVVAMRRGKRVMGKKGNSFTWGGEKPERPNHCCSPKI